MVENFVSTDGFTIIGLLTLKRVNRINMCVKFLQFQNYYSRAFDVCLTIIFGEPIEELIAAFGAHSMLRISQ